MERPALLISPSMRPNASMQRCATAWQCAQLATSATMGRARG
jgi:hypothetical protein